MPSTTPENAGSESQADLVPVMDDFMAVCGYCLANVPSYAMRAHIENMHNFGTKIGVTGHRADRVIIDDPYFAPWGGGKFEVDVPRPNGRAASPSFASPDRPLYTFEYAPDFTTRIRMDGKLYVPERPRDREVEILLSARHDLTSAAEKAANYLRTFATTAPKEVGFSGCDNIRSIANLIDKLAAYLIGGDERLISAGDEIDALRADCNEMTAQRDRADARLRETNIILDCFRTYASDLETQLSGHLAALRTAQNDVYQLRKDRERLVRDGDVLATMVIEWQARFTEIEEELRHLHQLNRDTIPICEFVEELSTMTDTECDFYDGADVRASARRVLNGQGRATVPRTYGEEDRKRAIQAIVAIGSAPRAVPLGIIAPEIVDKVAEMLGMRRAGV